MKAAAAMTSVGPMIERLLRQSARPIEPRFISPSPGTPTAVLDAFTTHANSVLANSAQFRAVANVDRLWLPPR